MSRLSDRVSTDETLVYDASPLDMGPGYHIPRPSPPAPVLPLPQPLPSSSVGPATTATSSSHAPAGAVNMHLTTPEHSGASAVSRSSSLYPAFSLWQSVARVVVPESLAVDNARARALAPSQASRLAPRLAQLRPLDLILVRTPGSVYSSLRALTRQEYDHMGIVLDAHSFLHIGPPVVRILSTQVLLDPARHPLVLRPAVSAAAAPALLAELRALVGRPYRIARVYAFIARSAADRVAGVRRPLAPPAGGGPGASDSLSATAVAAAAPADAADSEAYICTDSIMQRLLPYAPVLAALAERHRDALHIGQLNAWSLSDVVSLHRLAVTEARDATGRARTAAVAAAGVSGDATGASPEDGCALSEVPLPPAPPVHLVSLSALDSATVPADAAPARVSLPLIRAPPQSDADGLPLAPAAGSAVPGSAVGIGRARVGVVGALSLLKGVASSLADLARDTITPAAATATAAAATVTAAAASAAANAAASAGAAAAAVVSGVTAPAPESTAGSVTGSATESAMVTQIKAPPSKSSLSSSPLRAHAASLTVSAATGVASRARAVAQVADDMVDAAFARVENASLDWLLSRGLLDEAAAAGAARTAAQSSSAAAAAAGGKTAPAKASSGKASSDRARTPLPPPPREVIVRALSRPSALSKPGALASVAAEAWVGARAHTLLAARRAAVRALYTLLRRLWAVAKPALRVYIVLYILSFKFPWLLLLRTRLMRGLLLLNILGALAGADDKYLPQRLRRTPTPARRLTREQEHGQGRGGKQKPVTRLDAKL